MARPTKYSEEMLREVYEYFGSCGREQTELPTMEGLAIRLKVDTDTLNNWATEKNAFQELLHPEFFGAIKELKERQRNQLINDGMYGGKEVNSTMAIFLLKANHGMIETEKTILAGDGTFEIKVTRDTT